MQVINVRSINETVHRGVNRRGSATPSVEAIVKSCDHFVLALFAGVDIN
jgi:hypothetical protein